MASIIKLKRGLSENINNLTLQDGEIALLLDTNQIVSKNADNKLEKFTPDPILIEASDLSTITMESFENVGITGAELHEYAKDGTGKEKLSKYRIRFHFAAPYFCSIDYSFCGGKYQDDGSFMVYLGAEKSIEYPSEKSGSLIAHHMSFIGFMMGLSDDGTYTMMSKSGESPQVSEVIEYSQVIKEGNLAEADELKYRIPCGQVVLNELNKKQDLLMKEIELSTDISSPTEITNFTESGIYVAKNKGILGFQGDALTILAKGMFFRVFNLKDLYELVKDVVGEIPDEENLILIQVMSIEGYYDHILVKQGTNDWMTDNVTLNSLNVNDYVNVDIDTSRFIDKHSNISSYYGIQLIGDILAISSATKSEIDSGTSFYKPVSCNLIGYAVQKKGEEYFPSKNDFNTLNNDVTTLKSEIEQILNTVVTVNE